MAVKRIWALPPKKFQTSTGKTVLVGMTKAHDTGKVYKGTGARERERAAKRKKQRDGL